jgi:L-iditol 2-dehydrogenase
VETNVETIRAAVLHGREDVRVERVRARPLAAGEVRVEIRAALTCGTDLKVYKRGYHARMITPPAVFGHEFAGVINETGPEAAGWAIGDRVAAANSAPCGACFYCGQGRENLCDDLVFLNGAYAESIVIPARLAAKNLLRLKPETNFADAALVEPLACVVQGASDCDWKAGQRVLVIGIGPIGLMFVALARHAGLDVVAAGRGEARLEAARRLGASKVVSVAGAADLAGYAPLREAGPFDIVVEAVGKPETWESAVRLVRKGGLVNFFGGCPSATVASLDTGLVHYSSLRLIASFHHTPRAIRTALGLIEDGVARSADFVTARRRLDELPELFRAMAAGNQSVKTLIET